MAQQSHSRTIARIRETLASTLILEALVRVQPGPPNPRSHENRNRRAREDARTARVREIALGKVELVPFRYLVVGTSSMVTFWPAEVMSVKLDVARWRPCPMLPCDRPGPSVGARAVGQL